jgi:MFS transporter, ACS family, D-galactonate transporter
MGGPIDSAPAPSLSGPPTWVRWQVVALLVSYSFMTWFNRVSMSVAYDERIKDQTNIPPEEMGYVYSAFLFTYMLFMTPGGWLIDRVGAWWALVAMGFGSALFGIMTGLAGLPALVAAGLLLPVLLTIRALMGVCTAPIYPAASRLVAHWMPGPQRSLANGLIQGAAAVGIACVFPVFGALIDVWGWPMSFVVTGSVTALLAGLWMAYATDRPWQHRHVNEAELRLTEAETPIPEGPRPEQAPDEGGFLLGNRSLLLLTLSYAAVGYVEYLFFFWVHYYLENVLHFGTQESRLYAALLTLGMAAGMVAGGWLAGQLEEVCGRIRGRILVASTGLTAGAVLLVLGVLAEDKAAIVTWLGLALFAVGATEAPIWTTAVELGGRRGGTAAAICNTGGNAGGLLAPVITPWVSTLISAHFGLTEQAGWQWGIGLGALIGLLGASLLWWVTPRSQKGARLSPE